MASAIKSKRVPEKGGKFRVKRGCHIQEGPPGCECDDCLKSKGKDHVYTSYGTYARMEEQKRKTMMSQTENGFNPERHFLPPNEYDGDIIESEIDLAKRHNRRDTNGDPLIKFERIGNDGEDSQQMLEPQAPPEFPLERMNFAQLLAHAEELGIQTKDLKSKEGAIEAIRTVQTNSGGS